MNLFNYTINHAKNEDIEKQLLQCSKLFSPALDTYVSIPDYSKKIRENAVTVEAWHSDELIGLVACYLNNDRTHEGYITNVSVIHDYQGKGVAKKLIKNTIEEALNKKFKTLNLEVEVNNKWAIGLYRRSGFVLNGRLGSKYLMINRLLEKKDVFISICCVTYNHVKYIRDTIESFLMQKTDFPIEILIHDDASTDGTAEIIKEYEEKHPDIIKPILQEENQYSKGETISTTYQFPRALGKYIALCEGDDYWTDPFKLQKQVDFLEMNPDYSLCFHDVLVKWEKNKYPAYSFCKGLTKSVFQTEDIIKEYFIHTSSMVFYKDKLLPIPEWFCNIYNGDYGLQLLLANKGEIGYIPCLMSVYRRSSNSLSGNYSVTRNNLNLIRLLKHYNKHTNFKYTKLIRERISILIKGIIIQFMKKISFK